MLWLTAEDRVIEVTRVRLRRKDPGMWYQTPLSRTSAGRPMSMSPSRFDTFQSALQTYRRQGLPLSHADHETRLVPSSLALSGSGALIMDRLLHGKRGRFGPKLRSAPRASRGVVFVACAHPWLQADDARPQDPFSPESLSSNRRPRAPARRLADSERSDRC